MTQSPPRNAIAFLKQKNVVVDRILHHLLNKDNPGRDGDDNTSPALEEEVVVEYDSGCAQCGQVHILGNSSLRNRGVLNALADNLLWKKGETLVYYTTPKEGWPSGEIYELVASAAEVAVWVWNEIDLGITLTHARSKPTKFTHMIRYGDRREGNIAASGNFPTILNPRITFYEKAFSAVRGGRERLLSRMIHEFGHTLGFYHEFEADPDDGRGVAIGKRDVKSIMGYHRDRTITKSDIDSFPLIYEIKEGTEINYNTGAKVRYIKTIAFNEPDRSGDASDGREDGILDIFSPILRMFDINKQTLNKSIEASKYSKLLPKKLDNNEQENAILFERNAGILSTGLGLGINLLSTLFRSSDENRDGGILDSIVNIGKSLIVDAAKGAAEGALGGLLRSGDGTGIVVNNTVTPANMGVFAIKNLTETVGMRSITLLVDENDGPSSQMSKNQKIMASGEWLLSKYSQLLLWEMINIIIADKKSSSQNSMDSKELIKTIAHKSIDILENIPLLAASINVKDGTTMQGNDKHSLIESVIKHCREDNDQLPLVLKNLMLSVLLPHEDEESEHSLFGHIADYHNDHKLSSPRIIFYSITPDDIDGSWSLMIRDVEFFEYHLIYNRILKDHNNLDEVNAFCIAKNSTTSRHTLLQGLSPKVDRGPSVGRVSSRGHTRNFPNAFLDQYACGVLDPIIPLDADNNPVSGQGYRERRDNSYNDGTQTFFTTNDYTVLSSRSISDESQTYSHDSQSYSSRKERKVKDARDRYEKDSPFQETSTIVHSMANKERMEILNERRSRAHEKLMMHAYTALLSKPPPPVNVGEKGAQFTTGLEQTSPDSRYLSDTENQASLNSYGRNDDTSSRAIGSTSVDSENTQSIFSYYDANNRSLAPNTSSNTDASLVPNNSSSGSANAPGVNKSKPIVFQKHVLQKFCTLIKQSPIEVLKLNRDQKWQTRYLSVSKEGTWLKSNKKSDACFCPLGLLWVKKVHKSKEYSVLSIDKNGKGGMLLANLEWIKVANNQFGNSALTKKQLDKYHDSCILNLKGESSFITLRCERNVADAILTGCNAIIDVLNGKKNLKKPTNIQRRSTTMSSNQSESVTSHTLSKTYVANDLWEA